jgi:hypothetical protein
MALDRQDPCGVWNDAYRTLTMTKVGSACRHVPSFIDGRRTCLLIMYFRLLQVSHDSTYHVSQMMTRDLIM